MADQRFIIEMGMGNDMLDMDYQKAARRAIEDAYGHVTFSMWRSARINRADMRVVVTVGVQEPEKIDEAALAARMPYGQATVRAVFGGQNIIHPESGDTIVIATAAVEAFLPYQGEHWRAGTN